METDAIRQGQGDSRQVLAYLRKLLRWKSNDAVKLAFLEEGETDRVDGLDLTGVVEVKRGANGSFEAKFVDRVRVLAMLREVLEQRQDGGLEEFMDALKQPEDGDEA